MEPSPIQLTPEQQKEYLKGKQARFRELVEAAEEETGMTLVPFLDLTKGSITARLACVPKKVSEQPEV